MLFFKRDTSGTVLEVSNKAPWDARDRKQWECRRHMVSFEYAQILAKSASECTGKTYLAIDSGPWTSPRYDVIEAMTVGEPVSYGFNGDYYPDGEIVKIGKNHRIITTSTGARYYRRKLTGVWLKTGGTWALVSGHRNDKNPEF